MEFYRDRTIPIIHWRPAHTKTAAPATKRTRSIQRAITTCFCHLASLSFGGIPPNPPLWSRFRLFICSPDPFNIVPMGLSVNSLLNPLLNPVHGNCRFSTFCLPRSARSVHQQIRLRGCLGATSSEKPFYFLRVLQATFASDRVMGPVSPVGARATRTVAPRSAAKAPLR